MRWLVWAVNQLHLKLIHFLTLSTGGEPPALTGFWGSVSTKAKLSGNRRRFRDDNAVTKPLVGLSNADTRKGATYSLTNRHGT